MPFDRDDEKTDHQLVIGNNEYPCLELLSGARGGGRLPLKIGKNQIGRSRDNDVVLEDASVSRRHAVIEVTPQGATLSDLGSRNGTRVSGKKAQKPVTLAHNTRIKVGVYQLRFLTGPAQEVPEDVNEEPEALVSEEPSPAFDPDTNAGQESDLGAESAAEVELPAEQMEVVAKLAARRSLREGKSWKKWGVYGGLIIAMIVVLTWGSSSLFKIVNSLRPDSSQKQSKKTEDKKQNSVTGKTFSVEKESSSPTPQNSPYFLDVSSSPLSAQVYFGEQQIGTTPFRVSTRLTEGKWYEARAQFQLPEIGEVVEERARFSPKPNESLIPISFTGSVGVFKIAGLPRDVQLYLEGYFAKDPYRAKPIKFAEIVFGKPVYVPYGRYVVELRKSRQLGQSQTFLDEVVYRREFLIDATQTSFTLDIDNETLKIFPAQITSIPPGAHVLIDDKEVGVTPFQGTFPVGEHLMTLKHEGFFDFVQIIKMEMNMPYVAEIPLKTSEAGDLINRADALMKENRNPEALSLLVDSFSKNPSLREVGQISYMVGLCYLRQKSFKEAQDYFIKAMEHDDFKYQSRLGLATLTLEQGDSLKALQLLVEVLINSDDSKVRADGGALFHRISPLKSVMYITSEPSGARIFVNGVEAAQRTPLILHDIGVGSYRVQFRKEGYEDTEIKLNLGVSEFRPVVARLKSLGGLASATPQSPQTQP